MAEFTHLHVHTEYSLLDGLCKIPKLVAKAKELGFDALAITDHGVMYGVIEFYKECKAAGIKPIIGCEIYFVESLGTEKEKNKSSSHLVLLAKNLTGYKNLMKLVTAAHLEGFYYKPRVDYELLAKYVDGLICLSGCLSGPIAAAVGENNLEKAEELARRFKNIFGSDFYLEIQKHQHEKFQASFEPGSVIYNNLAASAKLSQKVLEQLVNLSKKLQVPVVATNDVHYVDSQDAGAQDVLLCIGTGKNLADVNRLRMIDTPTFYLADVSQMQQLFSDLPEAIGNTGQIAKKCDLEIPLGKIDFPKFVLNNNLTTFEYLRKLCYEGLKSSFEKITGEITKRLEYELSVIEKKNYASYFLVVADLANWAKAAGIISTTRGSASGSLVAYALGITTVDPISLNLPFERFLNPWRPSLPDIDLDFADDRRDEVIEYVKQKYGSDYVAQIGTLGTMMARAAVRDCARALGWPYTKADRIAKLIPFGSQGFPMTIEQAKKISRQLAQLYRTDDEVGQLLDLAQKIEGNARHASVHAAGVVISPQPLTEYTPLQKETAGSKIITQYDMYSVEEAGLVKIDFLGIRNLSILQKAVSFVEQTRGRKVDLDNLPKNDEKTFKLLASGNTFGLFQLGGSGMTRYLKELKPSSIFDIMAMISLFRPGPMSFLPEYIRRKHAKSAISYLDPRMKNYLEQSYGLIVYQDDVLLTAINIAGYSWEEADKFRKAMGKKIPAEMAKQRNKFIKGCIANGLPAKKAEQLFKIIEPFSAYGFNKAHAASYAEIAYQTAYMKANFPVEFMAAVATAESSDSNKIAATVAECKKLGIVVLPPDIGKSEIGFSIEKANGDYVVRFGLSAIKNVGQSAIYEILRARGGGGFASLNDFCNRVNLRTINRKTIESLIKAGAADCFGERNNLLAQLEKIKNGVSSAYKTAGQTSLFPQMEDQPDSAGNDQSNTVSKETAASWEKQFLGFYLTWHPLNKVKYELGQRVSAQIGELTDDFVWWEGKKVLIGGIVTKLRRTFTKAGNYEMAFATVEDETGSCDVVIFPKVFEKTKAVVSLDEIILVSGRVDLRDEQVFVIVEDAVRLAEADKFRFSKQEYASEVTEKTIQITLPADFGDELIDKVYRLLAEHPGKIRTNLVAVSADGESKTMPLNVRANLDQTLLSDLSALGCQVQTS